MPSPDERQIMLEQRESVIMIKFDYCIYDTYNTIFEQLIKTGSRSHLGAG